MKITSPDGLFPLSGASLCCFPDNADSWVRSVFPFHGNIHKVRLLFTAGCFEAVPSIIRRTDLFKAVGWIEVLQFLGSKLTPMVTKGRFSPSLLLSSIDLCPIGSALQRGRAILPPNPKHSEIPFSLLHSLIYCCSEREKDVCVSYRMVF